MTHKPGTSPESQAAREQDEKQININQKRGPNNE